jgi:hypothetical protein
MEALLLEGIILVSLDELTLVVKQGSPRCLVHSVLSQSLSVSSLCCDPDKGTLTRVKTDKATQTWTFSLQNWALFFISTQSQVFCYSNRKYINTTVEVK